MKIWGVVIFVGVLAFLFGRLSKKDVIVTPPSNPQKPSLKAHANQPTKSNASRQTASRREEAREILKEGGNLTSEQCLALTSEERIQMLQKGALIYDSLKQTDYLVDLISVLNADELAEARKYIGRAQSRGNYASQEVWNTLWKQAGRVAPLHTLENFGRGKPRQDARHIMEGWFETDASAALAWAQNPPQNKGVQYTQSAAYALTLSADGDPERLLQTLTEIEPHENLAKESLIDYFDLVDASGESEGTAEIYAQLPESLKASAWPVALRRISYTDKEETLNWIASHVNDEGYDSNQTARVIERMARSEPARITTWAAQITTNSSQETHPVEVSYNLWKRRDPAAADAWLQTIPANRPWAKRLHQLEP